MTSLTTETVFAPVCQVSNLEIKPSRVRIGEEATISVSVKNIGNTPLTCSVELRINGNIAGVHKQVVDPGQSRGIYFSFIPEREGIYNVNVNGLTGSLEVVKEAEKPGAQPINFAIILMIIAVILVLSILFLFLLFLLLYRRRLPPPPPP
jgi:hypothetical protein